MGYSDLSSKRSERDVGLYHVVLLPLNINCSSSNSLVSYKKSNCTRALNAMIKFIKNIVILFISHSKFRRKYRLLRRIVRHKTRSDRSVVFDIHVNHLRSHLATLFSHRTPSTSFFTTGERHQSLQNRSVTCTPAQVSCDRKQTFKNKLIVCIYFVFTLCIRVEINLVLNKRRSFEILRSRHRLCLVKVWL